VNVGKVRVRLDIAEHRAPQGGRFSIQVRSQAFDVRAQTQPAMYGEHLVLRLLPQERKPLGITDLGFSPELATHYRRLLQSPGGLVLADDPTRKVISIEDPIEYAIDGVQQCQVLPEIGFVFAQTMRAFVREDPDVILVGEIRDAETALEALRASQTGHLVLSTLHCNDTVDAVQRLLDLDMHRNSIGSELLAEVFPAGPPGDFRTFAGRGCPRCGGVGTYGRVAVAEELPVTATLRLAIARQLPLDELRAVARAAGLRPLREAALALVKAGVIAFGELRDMLSPDVIGGTATTVPLRDHVGAGV